MTLNLIRQTTTQTDFTPRITVIGVGGGGTNAVNNMIALNLPGVEFVVANTDAQQLMLSRAERRIQLGPHITQGNGAGGRPEIGKASAEEASEDLARHLDGAHMVFITAGMGGGTGTGAAPVIARMARERGILTVGVVTKPFAFEGRRRLRSAEDGINELQQFVDTLIVIPNQNLFKVANERTGWKEAFEMADHVLYMGVRGVTDLMVVPGLVNLDYADIRSVMSVMGKAMMGTGEAEGEDRAIRAAEAAISNPLLEDTNMKGARGLQPARALHVGVFEQRVGDRRLRGADSAILALGFAGAHHRLAHHRHHRADVGIVEVDEARDHHEVGNAAHAHVEHVVGHLEGFLPARALVGHLEEVLVRNHDQRIDELLQLVDPVFSGAQAAAALEGEGLGHHADREDAALARHPRDDRCCTRAGAAAHARGDEHHVRAVEMPGEVFRRFLGRGLADFRPSARAVALGDMRPELDAAFGAREHQLLRVGIGDDEFHARQIKGDHVVDRIGAAAADADHRDTRCEICLCRGLSDQVQGHVCVSWQAGVKRGRAAMRWGCVITSAARENS